MKTELMVRLKAFILAFGISNKIIRRIGDLKLAIQTLEV